MCMHIAWLYFSRPLYLPIKTNLPRYSVHGEQANKTVSVVFYKSSVDLRQFLLVIQINQSFESVLVEDPYQLIAPLPQPNIKKRTQST